MKRPNVKTSKRQSGKAGGTHPPPRAPSSRRRYGRHDVTGMSLAETLGAMRGDYEATKSGRHRKRLAGVAYTGSGADYHYRRESDWLRLLELARDIDRNDPLVGQGVTRLIDNVLGGSADSTPAEEQLRVDPQTGDEKSDAILAKKWREWTGDPDACHNEGEHDFHTLSRLALRSAIFDGDIFGVLRQDETIEIIEAHRVRTPRTKKNVVHGVLLDIDRRRLEVWVAKEDISPNATLTKVSDMVAVPIRDPEGHRQVLQVYNPKRVSQTRGVSALAPVASMIGMFDDLNFAKLVQAEVTSCFGVMRTRELEFSGGSPGTYGATTTETLDDGSTRTIEGMAPGIELRGLPGEKMAAFTAGVPNPEYFTHAQLLLGIIAVNLGIPLHVLLLDPSKTNFSGWRGAIDAARYGFRTIQGWMVRRWYTPSYEWKVRQWLHPESGEKELQALAAKEGVDILAHGWHSPKWPYIEPNKDAKADTERLKSHLISPRRLQSERGREWPRVAWEIVEDRALIIEMAAEKTAELNKQFPQAEINWREVAGFGLKGMKQEKNAGDQEAGDDEELQNQNVETSKRQKKKAAER